VVRGLLRQEGIRLQAGSLKSPLGWQRLMSRTYAESHWQVVLEAYFQSFLHLTRAIRQLEKELAKAEKNDERARRLRTIPGVGWVCALTFLSAVDTIQRFPSSRKLVGYSGLAPTVRESSERTEYGPITREGRKEIRGTWVEAAHRVVTQRSTEAKPLQKWYWKVAKRRGGKTAIVALTRKLLTVAYQMLKQEKDYDPGLIGRAA
jgi:transposase